MVTDKGYRLPISTDVQIYIRKLVEISRNS